MMGDHTDGKPVCSETVRSMYAFIDRELPADLSSHVKDHLGDCPPCEDAFVFEKNFKAVVAAKCKDEMPPELYVRVVEALHLETSSNPEGK